MGRDILSEYGPDKSMAKVPVGQSGLSSDGGKPHATGGNYCPPGGPINNMKESVRSGDVEPCGGMAGETLNEGGEAEFTGSPGLQGRNLGNGGSQGRY